MTLVRDGGLGDLEQLNELYNHYLRETHITFDIVPITMAQRTEWYTALFEALAGEDLHRAYAGIGIPNAASIALHERFGFARVAYFTEQGRKFGRYWDVAWYEKEL